jgi:hypothetical protein
MGEDGRLRINKRDPRYALAWSEILDVFAAAKMSVRRTGELLDLSTARTAKLMQQDAKVWAKVNEMRATVGAKPLRSANH